jgi:lysyl-tRNA synthetase class 2
MSAENQGFAPRATLNTLRLRAELLRRVRRFFDDRGFLEVETPILSADIVVDRHLDPLAIWLAPDARRPAAGQPLWLQTSPEFHMKRLLAAGAGPIYQIARVFRGGEQGPLHNPEFTMLEWYQPHVDYQSGMELLSLLASELLGRGPAERISYRQAFARHVGLDPHRCDAAELVAAATKANIVAPASLARDDRDGWLDLLLVERIEPHLGKKHPAILYDYPASQAALAQTRTEPDGAIVAERFELYADGIELANGYHELLDADVLRQRMRLQNALRRRDGKSDLPVENRLLAAMEAGLPPSVGVALGIDRLVMLAAGLKSVAEAMAFPMDEA